MSHSFKISIILFLFWGNLNAKVNFSSPVVKEVLFSIESGKVFSKSSLLPKTIVQNQLKYLFGVLNEMDSGFDFPSLKVEIKSIQDSNGVLEIQYNAKGTFAWAVNKEIPKTLALSLPKWGDEEGLTEFVNKYQEKCAKKQSTFATFWNYYRPNRPGCPLKDSISPEVILLSAHLKEATVSDGNREPRYRQIFDDNVLEITTIITKDDLTNSNDISIWDFNKLCGLFSADAFMFNQIINECHTVNQRNGQTVRAHVYLVDNFYDKPEEFLQKIRPFLLSSDVVTYNGHSGMGLNIESWMKLYPIPKDKYQIIFLNSCDTYGYFVNDFFDQFSTVNQTKNSSEYLDIILNATPNFFGTFANSNFNIIQGLLNGLNFDEIMRKLPVAQRSLLLHE